VKSNAEKRIAAVDFQYQLQAGILAVTQHERFCPDSYLPDNR
jgi:hypothetical protein